jgi:hypothetical protein
MQNRIIQIDSIHNRAISVAIGERLRLLYSQNESDLSSSLARQLERLRELDDVTVGCSVNRTMESQMIDDGYFILQNERLIDKAKTYDEAMKKGKAIKHSSPQSKVEIIYDGIGMEIPAGRK